MLEWVNQARQCSEEVCRLLLWENMAKSQWITFVFVPPAIKFLFYEWFRSLLLSPIVMCVHIQSNEWALLAEGPSLCASGNVWWTLCTQTTGCIHLSLGFVTKFSGLSMPFSPHMGFTSFSGSEMPELDSLALARFLRESFTEMSHGFLHFLDLKE